MTVAPPHRIVAVRLVSGADLSAVERLRAMALDEMSTLRGAGLYEAVPLPGADDAVRPLWVGLIAEEIAGYLAASVAGRVGRVDAVFVHPQCRAVGVGEGMMAEALQWFRAQGCIGVDAQALPGARATKNFFEESGFTARLLVMHRPL